MTATAEAGFDLTTFNTLLDQRSDEPAWLVERRRSAWESFEKGRWPAHSDEEWMRTDIRLFKLSFPKCRTFGKYVY